MSRNISAWTVGSVLGVLVALGCSAATSPALPSELAGLRPNRVEIRYVPPVDLSHLEIFELLKQSRVLERFQGYLSPLRLPKPLLLVTKDCDGESNAWYDTSDQTVTVCYEYVTDIKRNAPAVPTVAGVTAQDAVLGPVIEVFLHESSHAIFDLLRVPILGREEDAADQLAAYMILHLDRDIARQAIVGVAFSYKHDSQTQTFEAEDFADPHGLSLQRLYNFLCLAYGSDPEEFGDLVAKGYLPRDRAEGCADEYQQVDFAVSRLINPYVDQSVKNKVQPKRLLRVRPKN